MSKFLNDIAENKISNEEALQRLLIIANKTHNHELVSWCTMELNGYEKIDDLPKYRKAVNNNIIYSGINGRLQITNTPIGPGFLSQETLSKVSDMGIFENIANIEKNKDSKEMIYRDLTFLANEIYEKTYDGVIGVSCTSVRQLIPSSIYSNVYSSVKTRIINLLCSFETAKVNIDRLDISKTTNKKIKPQNGNLYQTIVVEGKSFNIEDKEKKILWDIIIPIISAVLSGLLVFLITEVWIK